MIEIRLSWTQEEVDNMKDYNQRSFEKTSNRLVITDDGSPAFLTARTRHSAIPKIWRAALAELTQRCVGRDCRGRGRRDPRIATQNTPEHLSGTREIRGE